MGTFKNLDRLLDSFTQGSIPGCACVVMQNHDILYESYSGFADIERGLKSTNVPFPPGVHNKTVYLCHRHDTV